MIKGGASTRGIGVTVRVRSGIDQPGKGSRGIDVSVSVRTSDSVERGRYIRPNREGYYLSEDGGFYRRDT
jgi:hypothetical protein